MALPMLQRSWAKIKQAQPWDGKTCASDVKVTDYEGWFVGRGLDNFSAFKGLSFTGINSENQQGMHWNWSKETVFRPSTTGMPSACRPSKSCWRVDWTWTSMLWAKSSGPKWHRCWEHFGLLTVVFFPQVASRLPFCGWLQQTTTWRRF